MNSTPEELYNKLKDFIEYRIEEVNLESFYCYKTVFLKRIMGGAVLICDSNGIVFQTFISTSDLIIELENLKKIVNECEDIKPCPFCGNKAYTDFNPTCNQEYLIHCPDCHCVQFGDSEEEAIEKWNTRKG